MELPPILGLGTILGILGRSITYIGLHARLCVWSLGTNWEGVKHPRPPDL